MSSAFEFCFFIVANLINVLLFCLMFVMALIQFEEVFRDACVLHNYLELIIIANNSFLQITLLMVNVSMYDKKKVTKSKDSNRESEQKSIRKIIINYNEQKAKCFFTLCFFLFSARATAALCH